MIRSLACTLALMTTLGAAACHPDRSLPMHPENPPGSWYVVDPGETLDQIARRAGVPAEDILELNGLSRASEVTPGRIIYVLEGNGVGLSGGAAAVNGAASTSAAPPTSAVAQRPLPAVSLMRTLPGDNRRFRWPLDRTGVASPFGARGGRPHEGIDLPAPLGTPVYAAAVGQVVYAGDAIRGYGNLIVLQHEGDLLTVYAHNSQLLVKEGERVAAGQRIALVGQSGHATGPHLHFEVREGQIPRDPMSYLAAPGSALAAPGSALAAPGSALPAPGLAPRSVARPVFESGGPP